jgi:hypothetical protein
VLSRDGTPLRPFSCRQMIAAIVRRRWRGGTLGCGRHASISGSNAAQRSLASMARLRKPCSTPAPT